MVPTLGNPIGKDCQFLFRFKRIIGAQVDAKIVWSVHALVHGKTQCYRSISSGFDGRRTDDGARRSAPLDQFDLRFTKDSERLIASVLYRKDSLDRGV